MHMGYCAHFAGDTVTPAIGEGGMLVVLSGSGRTSCTCGLAERAKRAGGRTFGILGTKYSPVEAHLDAVIHIPIVPAEGADADDEPFVQALGSSFEQAAFLFLEGVSHALFVQHGSDQRMLQQRHTNLE
jgi:6-phospho-3-hexuloisomerase